MNTEQAQALRVPFPAADHKDRKLPGGNTWFFIPWQTIRQRINQCDPVWSISYSDPVVVAESVVIRCQLTIHEITREGVGNDRAFPEKQTYGSPIERAIADAFKNAAEQFGVGAYLDSQDFVVKHMQQAGDGRAYAYSDRRKKVKNSR